MPFDPSKIFVWFTSPSNIPLALGLIGLALLLTRFAHLGRRLLVVGYLILLVLALSPLAYALLLPLEERFPNWDPSRGAPNGIIVLGGAINPYLSAARGEVSLTDAAERVTAIAELARAHPAAKIVFSGGTERPYPPEADLAVRLFESFGISRERILVENRSLSTAENARFSKTLLDPKPTERWLLVTSAAHMPRAMGAFRQAGFGVEAYPVDWQTSGRGSLLSFFKAPPMRLYLCDVATHEWIGLVVYWVRGQTSALFPGP